MKITITVRHNSSAELLERKGQVSSLTLYFIEELESHFLSLAYFSVFVTVKYG